MKNIYTFDIGNNNPHVGHFCDGHLSHVWPLTTFLSEHNEIDDESLIACSIVGPVSDELQSFFSKHPEKIVPLENWRTSRSFREMPVHYAETLGQDRLYQSYFLYKTEGQIIQNYNIILIDAGTFTTIDIISGEGLVGGFIIPGNQTYLEIFSKGKLLPVLDATQFDRTPDLTPHQLPNTTEMAIMQGLKLMVTGIYQYIDQNLADNRLCFIVTGGQGKSHWKAIRSLDNSSNLLLPYRHDIIHHSLKFLADLHVSDNEKAISGLEK